MRSITSDLSSCIFRAPFARCIGPRDAPVVASENAPSTSSTPRVGRRIGFAPPQAKTGARMLVLLLVIILVLALAGGIFISKFLFLLLLLLLVVLLLRGRF